MAILEVVHPSDRYEINAPECNYPYKIGIIIALFGAKRNKLSETAGLIKRGDNEQSKGKFQN